MSTPSSKDKTASSAEHQATRFLCRQLEQAITYERQVRADLANDPREAFLPAALHAYEEMMHVLQSPSLGSEQQRRVHAELMAVFAQPHYGGAQFQIICSSVDAWLEDVWQGNTPLPSLRDTYMAKIRNSLGRGDTES